MRNCFTHHTAKANTSSLEVTKVYFPNFLAELIWGETHVWTVYPNVSKLKKKKSLSKHKLPLQYGVLFLEDDLMLLLEHTTQLQWHSPWTFVAIFYPVATTPLEPRLCSLRHAQTHATPVPVPALVDDAGKPPRDMRAGINTPSRPLPAQP